MLSLSSNISSLLEAAAAAAAAKVRSTFWDDRVANLFDLGFKILFDFRFFFLQNFLFVFRGLDFGNLVLVRSLSLYLSHTLALFGR